MKKLLSCLFVLLASLCLVACQINVGVSVEGLEFSGQKTEFQYGEAFSSEGLVVTADLSNGTKLDVTAEATVTAPVDFVNVGSYEVSVTYDGFTASYTVTIVTHIEKVEVSTENAKTEYMVGEAFSSEGLVVSAVNTDGSLADALYTYEVTDANGKVVETFEYTGEYTVTISVGEVSTSYTVTVVPAVFNTVSAAINAGVAASGKVVSGTYS